MHIKSIFELFYSNIDVSTIQMFYKIFYSHILVCVLAKRYKKIVLFYTDRCLYTFLNFRNNKNISFFFVSGEYRVTTSQRKHFFRGETSGKKLREYKPNTKHNIYCSYSTCVTKRRKVSTSLSVVRIQRNVEKSTPLRP